MTPYLVRVLFRIGCQLFSWKINEKVYIYIYNANVHGQFYATLLSLNTRFHINYENCRKFIRTEVGPGCVNTTIPVILVTMLQMIAILIQVIIIIIIMKMHVLDDYLQIRWTSYQNRQLICLYDLDSCIWKTYIPRTNTCKTPVVITFFYRG